MRVFAQIFKVDEARQEVWGRATQEVVDKAGEIFDYETSKPLFQKWSEGFAADTDGKSLGNIRSMHGKVAAGKVISIDFNDAEKAIDIGTKIVDKNEWEKVMEGVHTGFSIGGSYAKKWADGEHTRFTADPSEISLVDSPCVPTAKFFDVLKADGATEQKEFKQNNRSENADSEVTKASAKAMAKLQAIHDHTTSMGASCGPASQEKAMTPEDLQKMDDLAKRMDDMTAALAKADEEKAALLDRIAKLEAMPEAPKGVAKAADDAAKGAGAPMTMDEMEKAAESIEDPAEKFKALLQLTYAKGPK